MRLLTTKNPKTLKGVAKGYNTAVLHLAPANLSGYCVCPHSTEGCRAACLNNAGRSAIPMPDGSRNVIQKARIAKTLMFFKDRERFLALLKREIRNFVKRSYKAGLKPCVRLNGTSDLPWEKFGVMQEFPEVIWYDYTKSVSRMQTWLDGGMPDNYHLTFSRSECNESACRKLSAQGANVAAVFNVKRGKPLPEKHYGVRVIDADKNDLRFLDGDGVVCGLRFKHLFKDESNHGGFIVEV